MNYWFSKCSAILLFFIFVAVQPGTSDAFSFDSVWFYRNGTKVVPEIGRRWLTVVFDARYIPPALDFQSADDGFIREKAKAIMKSNDRLIEYFYDRNLAEDACFFRMRDNLRLEDISYLINQLSQDKAVRYVHPTVVLNNKTYAFFNQFQMEWKTGTGKAERESLLSASRVVFNEEANTYAVDVKAIPFFKALNLLAEDIRVLRVTPYLVEIKPSIRAEMSFFMSGANIGDSIPFTLTIFFSERVNVDPSSIATINLRPSNLQAELFDCTFDPYDYAKAVTKSPIVITGRVKFFAPGEFTIPPVTISYSCPSCSDSSVHSIDTEPLLVKVSSIIPSGKSANRLIVPTDATDPDFRLAALHQQSRNYLWLAITGFAGFILCSAWLVFLRRKITAEREQLKERKDDQLILEQLRTLLQSAPTAPHWIYLAEVGTLLREYLVAHYGIDVKYQGGSGRQFMETISAHVPRECIDSLSIIFSIIDNSVSLESEHHPDIDQLQGDIVKVLDSAAQNTAARG